MHRAKHRAAAGAGAEVSAVSLLERYASVPGPRRGSDGPRHGVATLPAPPVGGPALFGAAPPTGPMLAVEPDDDAPRDTTALFGGEELFCGNGGPQPGDSPLFGAARHSRGATATAIPAPRVPAPAWSPKGMRSQPVGAALSITVFGAAAAVTAVIAPQSTVLETTGSMAPVERPAPAPVQPIGPVVAAPAPAALPDQPTVKVGRLVTDATAQMQKVEPAKIVNVASTSSLASPAAVRKAALTSALGKLGTPYRWGAMGPNAFDCSGLVKWSFANAGKKLPRTSRAMASQGVKVAKADLQPGDLVFFYSPISHVGIYLGNNKIVHASRAGQPVKVSDMSRMRFTTARRI
jgi:peptidoglycan DL-endopeptidase CwlO